MSKKEKRTPPTDEDCKRVSAQVDRIMAITEEYKKTRLECQRLLRELGITEDELIKRPEGTFAKLEEDIAKAREKTLASLANLVELPTVAESDAAVAEAKALLERLEAIDAAEKTEAPKPPERATGQTISDIIKEEDDKFWRYLSKAQVDAAAEVRKDA